jgi:hypothetical protein
MIAAVHACYCDENQLRLETLCLAEQPGKDKTRSLEEQRVAT